MTKSILLILLFCFTAYGQVETVHPKVVEVQESIKFDVKEYLGSVLPNGSFVISVKIDPLRRGVPSRFNRDDAQALPYMQVNGDKVIDEWDDPQAQVYSLYNRIRSVKVSLDLSNDVNIKDMDQFKRDLFKSTELVPGRDNVEIKRGLNFSIEKPLSKRLLSMESILVFIFSIVIFVSLYSQSRAFKKFGQSLDAETSVKASQSGAMQAPAAPAFTQSSSSEGGDSSTKEFSISNPIILRDVIKDKLSEIDKVEDFPLLSDMITLEELSIKNKEAFSFLIFEFPVEFQTEILKRGRTRAWLEAFSCSGQAHNDAIRALDQMIRNRKENINRLFEDLLIQMWRLDDNLESFISSMDRQFGLGVLSCLPKVNALPIARTLFPGDWGKVLDDNFELRLEDVLMQREFQRALDKVPYYDFSSLSQFRNQRDLLFYLKDCGIQEEKDIYVMRGEGDVLERLRPPFFRFFELEKSQMIEVFFRFSIEDWSIAIFNSPRNYREALDSFLTDKQGYLLTEHLKTANQHRPSAQLKASIREKIAIAVDDVRKNSKLVGQEQSQIEDKDAFKAA